MYLEVVADRRLETRPDVLVLPLPLRTTLGVIPGQRIVFRRGEQEVVLLVLSGPGELARAAPATTQLLRGRDLEVRIPDITLGCDPEFFIFWRGRQMSAATYLPFRGQIGADGGLGELRPRYGTHESRVVSNLGRLIPAIPGRMRRSRWATGFPEDGRQMSYEAYSYREGIAAGFHVHLGLPPELLHLEAEMNSNALVHLVRCLDWYASVPLTLLEVDNQRRCGRTPYGLPGDYRITNFSLEYRTPGAFYLRHPVLAGGLLGLSLAVAEHFVSRLREPSRDFTALERLTPSDLQAVLRIPRPELIQGTLIAEDKQVSRRAFPEIRRRLTGFLSYPRHAASLEKFFSAVETGFCPSPYLTENWRTPN